MAWMNFHGAYNNTGPYANVVIGGNPGSTGDFGAPLDTAHASGYGYGINFVDNGNYSVTIQLNLVGYSVSDGGVYLPNMRYVQWGGRYNYILVVGVSNNGGASYRDIYNQIIFSHGDTWSLLYLSGWQTTAANSQWSGTMTIPSDTTHVRVELKGEDATFPYANIYEIEKIITKFRPWAVRKGGTFRSLNNPTGWLKKRKSGKWADIETMSEAGQANKGTSRIRKSGTWVGQNKIGG